MQKALKTAEIPGLDENKAKAMLTNGKLNSGQIKRLGNVSTLQSLKKDIEDTKITRVHGGIKPKLFNELSQYDHELKLPRWSEKKEMNTLYRDSLLGIDIINV